MDLGTVRAFRTKSNHVVLANLAQVVPVYAAKPAQLAKAPLIEWADLVPILGVLITSAPCCPISRPCIVRLCVTSLRVKVCTLIPLLTLSVLDPIAAGRDAFLVEYVQVFALVTFLALILHPVHTHGLLLLADVHSLVL